MGSYLPCAVCYNISINKEVILSILVTGGTGYIGSHTVVELIEKGKEVVVVDDLSNSNEKVLGRVEQITGVKPKFYEVDILKLDDLKTVFEREDISSVIHFAGFKAVGESVEKPLMYYRNNIDGLLNVLELMQTYGVNEIVFSSSATVYGDAADAPYSEDNVVGVGITNPYGQTKYMCEQILRDQASANPALKVAILRYFNPVGAHPSSLIGEDPSGVPNNLMPFISQVAAGKRAELSIFGGDYETKDGTGVRDYLHVVDLAKGHLAALDYLSDHSGAFMVNLGTGVGYSVLDLVKAFSEVNNIEIPYKIIARRAGDLAEFYADPSRAENLLGWKAELSLREMCRDSWNWQSKNPEGYK